MLHKAEQNSLVLPGLVPRFKRDMFTFNIFLFFLFLLVVICNPHVMLYFVTLVNFNLDDVFNFQYAVLLLCL